MKIDEAIYKVKAVANAALNAAKATRLYDAQFSVDLLVDAISAVFRAVKLIQQAREETIENIHKEFCECKAHVEQIITSTKNALEEERAADLQGILYDAETALDLLEEIRQKI